jgi:hypothetical protein
MRWLVNCHHFVLTVEDRKSFKQWCFPSITVRRYRASNDDMANTETIESNYSAKGLKQCVRELQYSVIAGTLTAERSAVRSAIPRLQ